VGGTTPSKCARPQQEPLQKGKWSLPGNIRHFFQKKFFARGINLWGEIIFCDLRWRIVPRGLPELKLRLTFGLAELENSKAPYPMGFSSIKAPS